MVKRKVRLIFYAFIVNKGVTPWIRDGRSIIILSQIDSRRRKKDYFIYTRSDQIAWVVRADFQAQSYDKKHEQAYRAGSSKAIVYYEDVNLDDSG